MNEWMNEGLKTLGGGWEWSHLYEKRHIFSANDSQNVLDESSQ